MMVAWGSRTLPRPPRAGLRPHTHDIHRGRGEWKATAAGTEQAVTLTPG